MITKAMVMSAGVGSRLEPLTLTTPKPLIKIANIPVMDILLCNLKKYGISDVIANTYYLAEQIIERYSNKKTKYHNKENLKVSNKRLWGSLQNLYYDTISLSYKNYSSHFCL